MRVADYLDRAVREHPERTAIACGETRYSYPQYREKVLEVCRGLASLGLMRGDRIALCMGNIPEHPLTFLAAERMGLASLMVNNRLMPDEIYGLISDGRPRLFVVDGGLLEGENGEAMVAMLSRSIKDGVLERVLVTGGGPVPDPLEDFDRTISSAAEVDIPCGEEDDVVAIIFTSGTTGKPKGAMITDRNIVANMTSWKKRLEVETGLEEADEVIGVFFPLFHAAGMIGGVCGCVIFGLTLVLAPFDIEGSLQLIEREGVTLMGAVAAMTALQLMHPGFDDYDLSSLKYIIMGAGPCPPEIIDAARDKMGAEVIVSYGLTEGTMGNLITTMPEDTDEHKLHTIGVPMDDLEVRLVDEEGNDVEDGAVGQIAVRGDTVFAGYLDDPETTAQVLDSRGWLYTGDLAVRQPDGYYRLIGRTTEMYIRGGENVYPREIEDVIQRHPQVTLAAVLGIPHEVFGEVGRAYVMLAPGSDLDADDLLCYCSDNLADYKVPEELVIRDMLPLTPVGKVMKKVLRQEIREEYGIST